MRLTRIMRSCVLVLGFAGQTMAVFRWPEFSHHWPEVFSELKYELRPTSRTSLPLFCHETYVAKNPYFTRIEFDTVAQNIGTKHGSMEGRFVHRLTKLDRQLRCAALALNVISPNYDRGWDGQPDWYKKVQLRMSMFRKEHAAYIWMRQLRRHRDYLIEYLRKHSHMTIEELKHLGEIGAEDIQAYYDLLKPEDQRGKLYSDNHGTIIRNATSFDGMINEPPPHHIGDRSD